jgi:TM2 domain-containing membrane protein YozV
MSEPTDNVPPSDDLGYPRHSEGYPAQQGPYPPAQYPQQHQQPYPQMMVAPKSPGVAVLASFFIPGLGSMISGRGGMGALILCLYIVSWILTIVLIGFIGVFGFWLWGMIQGYADAVAWNRSHGIIS